MAGLSSSKKKEIENKVKQKISVLGKTISDSIATKYLDLISDYYAEKEKNKTRFSYKNIPQLQRSYMPFYQDTTDGLSVGIRISAKRMKSYPSGNEKGKFSAKDLLDKYIVFAGGEEPYFTTHGGDWHGGYGTLSNVNIWEEINNYTKDLANEFK